MHPEVVFYVGLLTLLYAETTSLFSFKYSILNDIVKKLKQWSISAGNIFNVKYGTSETLCNETVINTKNVKLISVHKPKHLKPINDDSFGHYLAGLIDGDGHFSTQQQLVIVFHSQDASLAYYLKKRLGFGIVKKVKNKNAFILIISAIYQMEKVISLINGKIRTKNKFNQITNNILNHSKYFDFREKINFKLNLDKDLKNHWLAGFSDADGSFQIKVLNRNNRFEVRLNFQIDQKEDNILLIIREFLGGFLSYNKLKNEYTYSSDSYSSARKIIQYFDNYHLLSHKYVHFIKWRKSYILAQNGNYTDILKYSKTLSPKLNSSIINNLKFSLVNMFTKRLYSTMVLKENNVFDFNLNPNFITGFSDGESTFSFTISKSNSKRGWVITPSFSIELHRKDIALLKRIQSFFGVGKIITRSRDNQVIYAVKSLKELHNVIIPHFIKYPLLTQKKIDFELFILVIELMMNKEHLTELGLRKIFSIKASLGKGLSKKLINVFPDLVAIEKPIIKMTEIVDNHWLGGFTSAEGCFDCIIRKNSTTKIGHQVAIRLTIIQHSRDTLLINVLKNHLGCGVVRVDSKKPQVTLSVTSFSEIFNIIIPFFDKYLIQGIKLADYLDFRKIAFLMKDKIHLTTEGFNKILNIKARMNSKRES